MIYSKHESALGGFTLKLLLGYFAADHKHVWSSLNSGNEMSKVPIAENETSPLYLLATDADFYWSSTNKAKKEK